MARGEKKRTMICETVWFVVIAGVLPPRGGAGFFTGPHAFLTMKYAYAGANSRSVMPLNVLGSTRTTLVW